MKRTPSTSRPAPRRAPARRGATWLAAAVLLGWVLYFAGPGLAPGRVLQGTDLVARFPPWNEARPASWEAANYLLFDQAVQFFPWRLLTRAMAAAGLPPLWNPFAYGGAPLLANEQSAPLAPVEVLAGGLPWDRAPGVAAAARLALAALGMLLLLRRAAGLGALAACFGALAFAGSGSITLLLYHPNSNVACLLPLVAWLAWRVALDGRGRDGAWLAVVLGAGYLGGHPESSLYLGIASLLVLAAGLWSSRGQADAPRRRRRLAIFAAAQLLGLALALVQILPFLEYLREGAVLDHRSGVRFASNPRAAAGMLIPQIFGTPTRPNTYWGPQNYHAVATQYAGLVCCVIALVGGLVWWRRRRAAAGAAAAAAAAAADAAGWWLVTGLASAALAALLVYPTPLWRLAGLVPLFRISANVTGLTLLFTFSLAIAGAAAIQLLSGGAAAGGDLGTPRVPRAAVLVVAAVALLALAAELALPAFEDRLFALGEARLRARYLAGSHYRPLAYYVERLPLVLAAVRQALLWAGALGLGVAALLWGHARLGGRRFALLALLLLAIDLAHFGRGYVPAVPRGAALPWHEAIGVLRVLHPGRVLPTGRAFPANTLTAWGIEDFRGHDAVGPRAQARLFRAMSTAPPLRRTYDTYRRDLVDAAGIDCIVAPQALADSTLLLVYRSPRSGPTGSRTHIYRNPRAWPRAFVLEASDDDAAGAGSAAEAGAAAADPARPGGAPPLGPPPLPQRPALAPATTGRAVAPAALWRIVELCYPAMRRFAATRAAAGALGPPAARPPAPAVRGLPVSPTDLVRRFPIRAGAGGAAREIGTVTQTPLAATAELTLPRAAWLVLLDADFPGWTVAVDGEPAPARRAGAMFRAVAVPAGHHAVVWSYRPASFAAGLVASLAAALAWLGWLAATLVRARRTPPA